MTTTAINKATSLVTPQHDQRLLASAAGPAALHDMIAQRAYSLWQLHGCPVGTALKDWLQAEAEVKGEIQRAKRLQPAAR
jgi:Protein of unknown function (DUF2934)